jgi:hypothetical protein
MPPVFVTVGLPKPIRLLKSMNSDIEPLGLSELHEEGTKEDPCRKESYGAC